MQKTILVVDNSILKKIYKEETDSVKTLFDFLSSTADIEDNVMFTKPSLYVKYIEWIKLNTVNQRKALAAFNATMKPLPSNTSYSFNPDGLAKIADFLLSEFISIKRVVILTEKFTEKEVISSAVNKTRIRVYTLDNFIENEIKNEIDYMEFIQRWNEFTSGAPI